MGGLEAVRRLLAHDESARILALSAHEDTAYPQRVLKAGALGYLSKRSARRRSSTRCGRWRRGAATWTRN